MRKEASMTYKRWFVFAICLLILGVSNGVLNASLDSPRNPLLRYATDKVKTTDGWAERSLVNFHGDPPHDFLVDTKVFQPKEYFCPIDGTKTEMIQLAATMQAKAIEIHRCPHCKILTAMDWYKE